MAYNMTAIDGANTLSDMFVGINGALNGSFVMLILVSFYILLIIGFKRYETAVGLIASSSIMFFISWLLSAANLLNVNYVFIPLSLLMVGIIYKVFN